MISQGVKDMLKDRTAIITGSTSGIGLGIAETLAAAGATVMLNGFGDAVRIEEIRRNLAERHGVRVAYSGDDLSKPADYARLADMLVGSHLAACVQILPEIESVYRWQGKIERQQEILLLAKSTTDKFDELEREVRALHSYETPEIIAVSLADVSEPYLKWLVQSVS